MRVARVLQICFLASFVGVTLVQAQVTDLDTSSAERFVRLALECVHREYPNKIAHVLNDASDAKTPQQLTPSFYGCYDWHSAVHGHWLLARLARTFPEASCVAEVRSAI